MKSAQPMSAAERPTTGPLSAATRILGWCATAWSWRGAKVWSHCLRGVVYRGVGESGGGDTSAPLFGRFWCLYIYIYLYVCMYVCIRGVFWCFGIFYVLHLLFTLFSFFSLFLFVSVFFFLNASISLPFSAHLSSIRKHTGHTKTHAEKYRPVPVTTVVTTPSCRAISLMALASA